MKNLPWILLLLFIYSCKNKNQPAILFNQVPVERSNINFSNDLQYEPQQNIVEYLYYYNGGGVAAGDINNDGLIDLFFTANQKTNQLYLNKGDFKFEEISDNAGISEIPSWSTGVTMADINGDGWLDIYVCEVGNYKSFNGRNKFYLNKGDLTFEEVSAEWGLDFSGFSTQSSFFDYDRDGDLDMYLLNHSVHTPRSYRDAETRNEFDSLSGDRLYENLLNEGINKFTNATKKTAIYSSTQGYGLGVVTSDINQDGWIDIYVGNDFHENDYLYINQRNGTFKESIADYISHTSRFSMGVDIGDLNNDNLVDIVSLDMLPKDPGILLRSGGEDNNQVTDIKLGFGYEHQFARNAVQINKGNGTFAELGLLTNTYATDWSWSVLIADFDNDARSDFFITNGIFKRPNDLDYINYLSNVNMEGLSDKEQEQMKQELIERMPTIKIPNYAFMGTDDIDFKEVSEVWGLSAPSYSNGAAYADLDLDGDLDLIVNNVNQPAFVYENRQTQNNYLSVHLKDTTANRFGIGAKITVHSGSESWRKELTTSRGFQSSSPTIGHFGLGKLLVIDSVSVEWPDGTIQIELPSVINSVITIEKKGISKGPTKERPNTKNIELLDFTHKEDDFFDYNIEHLIPHKLSTEGPAFAVGDVNKDGVDDLFLGGAHGQAGEVFLATSSGEFKKSQQDALRIDRAYEDVDAKLFDLDGDLDLDLYVVSGGNRFSQGSYTNTDRIYLNDGMGEFERLEIDLPLTNGGSVAICADKQGILIFVGGRSVPGAYGITPKSYLLSYRDQRVEILDELELGMVTDTEWFDFDNDGLLDLVVTGEWMPLTILKNMANLEFKDVTAQLGLDASNGWWNSIELADLNSDGITDIVAGNYGSNSKLKPSVQQPTYLYLGDFDQNGQVDPLIFYYYSDVLIPLASRDDLINQLPFIKRTFRTYNDFSNVRSFEDLIKVKPILKKEVYEMKSAIFLNKTDQFEFQPLPDRAQWSPIQNTLSKDVNGDDHLDLIVVGNFFGSLAKLGRNDASNGALFLNDGTGQFEFYKWLPVPLNMELRHVYDLGDNQVLLIPNNDKAITISLDDF